jgi:hypothetical protein
MNTQEPFKYSEPMIEIWEDNTLKTTVTAKAEQAYRELYEQNGKSNKLIIKPVMTDEQRAKVAELSKKLVKSV